MLKAGLVHEINSSEQAAGIATAPPSPTLDVSWSSVDDRALSSVLSGLKIH